MLIPSHLVNEPNAGVKRSLKTQILLAGDVCKHSAAVIEMWQNQSQNEPYTERLREKMLTHLQLMHRGVDSRRSFGDLFFPGESIGDCESNQPSH